MLFHPITHAQALLTFPKTAACVSWVLWRGKRETPLIGLTFTSVCVCVNDTIKEPLLLSFSRSELQPEVKCCQREGQPCTHLPSQRKRLQTSLCMRKLAVVAGIERGRVDVALHKGMIYCSWSSKQLCQPESLNFSPFATTFQIVGPRSQFNISETAGWIQPSVLLGKKEGGGPF